MNTAAIFMLAVVAGIMAEAADGIAARYAGDVGIEKDAEVLFVALFEEGSVAQAARLWTDQKGLTDGALALAKDVPPGSPGKQSLAMTATKGKNSGGHLWKLFKPGVDVMHARFYVKFSKDHPYVHHFVKIGAWRDSPNWPQGEAGYRPSGAKSFQTGIEPGSFHGKFDPPGAWHFYTYWNEMRSWQGPGGSSFYGNGFAPAQPRQIPRDRWQCVEFMVKANTKPDAHDGEQAFWIDGELAGRFATGSQRGRWSRDQFVADEAGEEFPGYRWRTDDAVKINVFWLLYYMENVFKGDEQFKPRADIACNPNEGTVWFDHVVVAKSYIGPLAASK